MEQRLHLLRAMNGRVAIVGFIGCALTACSSGTSGAGGDAAPGAASSAWGFSYEVPAGWKAQDRDPFTLLGSDTDPGVVLLGRATFTTDAEAIGALASVAKALKLTGATAIEPPADATIAGLRAVTATYAVYGPSGEGRARYIGLFTDYGTSLGIMGLTTPAQFDALRAKVDALAASVTARAPTVEGSLVQALVGRWRYLHDVGTTNASHSIDATITFDGASFSYDSSSEVFVSVDDEYAYGNTSEYSQTSDRGAYTVIGAQLVCKGQKGTFVVPFTLDANGLTIDGRTYFRD